jgi:hypothetical protein
VFWFGVTTNNTLRFQLNPRQKLDVILVNGTNFGSGTFNIETGITHVVTLSKPTPAASGYMPQAKIIPQHRKLR